jgi:glycosyltransferase involved in cell wall biosynthesis
MPSNANRLSAPRISVVIPVHNGAATLRKCLAAISASELDDYEVIVVEDGSTDRSAAIGEQFGCTVIRLEERHGAGNARNHGARRARAPFVFFTDADVLLPSNALRRVVADFERHPEVAAVQGIYRSPGLFDDVINRYQNDYYHYFCRRIKGPYTNVFATWCAAVKRDVFWEIGGFDRRIKGATVEDEELGYELVEQNAKILLDRELLVDHLADYNMTGFLRRRFTMARNQIKSAFRKAPRRLFKRYANVGRNLTHHSRKILLSIPLSYIIMVSLVLTAAGPTRGSLAVFLAASFFFVLLSGEFSGHVVRTHGVRAILPTLGMLWFDMLAVGAGLVVGGVEFIFGKRY